MQRIEVGDDRRHVGINTGFDDRRRMFEHQPRCACAGTKTQRRGLAERTPEAILQVRGDVEGVIGLRRQREWQADIVGIVLAVAAAEGARSPRSEEHTSELQSLMRISYAVFCFKNKKN